MSGWPLVLVASLGCYAFKAGGAFVPRALLDRPLVTRLTALLPVALILALVAVNTFSTGRELVVDARAAGLAIAALLVWRRAPFLVVVIGAAAVAAGLRALG